LESLGRGSQGTEREEWIFEMRVSGSPQALYSTFEALSRHLLKSLVLQYKCTAAPKDYITRLEHDHREFTALSNKNNNIIKM
jgi:hypothetical protein